MMHVETVLFFETPEEIYARVFRLVKPRTVIPEIKVEFCAFANVNSTIRLQDGRLHIRMSDLFEQAPAPVLEALAYILVSKLYRQPVPKGYNQRYRLYLHRKDVRQHVDRMRKQRGRKLISDARGDCYDLQELFEEINRKYFGGLMARPDLGWSRRASRTMLGHYDPSHHAIVLSKLLDRPEVPRLAVEYVMYHEMLHLRYPVDHRGGRRCVHTPEFKEAEREFIGLAEARRLLKQMA